MSAEEKTANGIAHVYTQLYIQKRENIVNFALSSRILSRIYTRARRNQPSQLLFSNLKLVFEFMFVCFNAFCLYYF